MFSGIIYSDIIKSSSIQDNNDAFKADNVMDGNMETRWSSDFSDEQWLLIDFVEDKEFVGLQLFWEAAYGQSYTISISQDGIQWKNIFKQDKGKGILDDIYFGKQKCRFLKINFMKRGTPWGYSLWEVKLKGLDQERLITVSSDADNNSSQNIMDADLNTFWKSNKNEREWIAVDLRKRMDIGNITIHWGTNFAKLYKIDTSDDNIKWETVYTNKNGNGKVDYININLINKQFFRLELLKSNLGMGYDIKEINVNKWQEIANKSSLEIERGLAGWPRFKWDTFIGKDGSFGPDPHPFQLGFWIYNKTDKKLYTPETLQTKWTLDQGRFPINIIEWENDDIKVKTTIFVTKINDSLVYNLAQLKLINRSNSKKEFFICLKIQPNPLLLKKGQKINAIEFDGQQTIKINNQASIFINSKINFEAADQIEFSGFKTIRPNQKITDSKALLVSSVKLNKDNEGSMEIVVPTTIEGTTYNKKFKEIDFNNSLQTTRKYWTSLIPMTLSVPDKDYEDCFYASLYYMLIMMDGNMIYPGAYAYKTFFLHDAVEMVNALEKVGLNNIAEDILKLFKYQDGDGYQDGMGGSIFSLFDHYRITHNIDYLKQNYLRIKNTCLMIINKRKEKLQEKYIDSPFYGLLPPSVSQDNFKLPSHLYQDNWWSLIGLKCGLEAADILGYSEDYRIFKDEFDNYKKCIFDSIKKVMAREKIDYIPAFVDDWPKEERIVDEKHRILGETQMGSSHRSILFPGQSLGIEIPKPLFAKSYKHYWDVCSKFSGYDGGWFVEYEQVFWGYNAMLAHPPMYLGMEDVTLKSLEWLIKNESCPRGWMEAMPSRTDENGFKKIGTGIIGDVPHGWVAAYYVLLLRNMLVREEDNLLFLLSCVPEQWIENGKVIQIENAPTYYGMFNMNVESFMEQGFIKITLLNDDLKKDYMIFSPHKTNIKKVIVDGKENNIIDSYKVKVSSSAKEILLYF